MSSLLFTLICLQFDEGDPSQHFLEEFIFEGNRVKIASYYAAHPLDEKWELEYEQTVRFKQSPSGLISFSAFIDDTIEDKENLFFDENRLEIKYVIDKESLRYRTEYEIDSETYEVMGHCVESQLSF